MSEDKLFGPGDVRATFPMLSSLLGTLDDFRNDHYTCLNSAATFLQSLDSILFCDRIVSPRTEADLIDEFKCGFSAFYGIYVVNPTTEELRRKGIIHFVKEPRAISSEKYKKLRMKMFSFATALNEKCFSDCRSYVLNILKYPESRRNWLKAHEFRTIKRVPYGFPWVSEYGATSMYPFGDYWRQNMKSKISWTSSTDIHRLHAAFMKDPPFFRRVSGKVKLGYGGSYGLDYFPGLDAPIDVLCLAGSLCYDLPTLPHNSQYVDVWFGRETIGASKSAHEIVLDKLDRTRSDLTEKIVSEDYLPRWDEVETPLALSTLLRDIKSKKPKPSDFYDAALNKRKDRSIRRFRKWLAEFNRALKDKDRSAILKCRAQIRVAASKIREEYETVRVRQTTRWNFIPTLAYNLVKRDIPAIANTVAVKLIDFAPELAEHLGLNISIWQMQGLLKSGIDSQASELKKLGPIGEQFYLVLKHRQTLDKKVLEVIKLPPSLSDGFKAKQGIHE